MEGVAMLWGAFGSGFFCGTLLALVWNKGATEGPVGPPGPQGPVGIDEETEKALWDNIDRLHNRISQLEEPGVHYANLIAITDNLRNEISALEQYVLVHKLEKGNEETKG